MSVPIKSKLKNLLKLELEIAPQIIKMDLNKLLDRLGMETELKEKRIVDNRKLIKWQPKREFGVDLYMTKLGRQTRAINSNEYNPLSGVRDTNQENSYIGGDTNSNTNPKTQH